MVKESYGELESRKILGFLIVILFSYSELRCLLAKNINGMAFSLYFVNVGRDWFTKPCNS